MHLFLYIIYVYDIYDMFDIYSIYIYISNIDELLKLSRCEKHLQIQALQVAWPEGVTKPQPPKRPVIQVP